MHGEDLHAPGGHPHLSRGQAVFDGCGGVEISQQAGHVATTLFGVAGDDVGEAIQVFGAGAVGVDRPGGAHLGVHTDDPADLGRQIGDRVRQKTSKPSQLGGQCGDPRVARLRVGIRCTRIGKCVGQAGGLGVRGGDDLLYRVGEDAPPIEDHRAAP